MTPTLNTTTTGEEVKLPGVLRHKYQQLRDPKKYAQLMYLTCPNSTATVFKKNSESDSIVLPPKGSMCMGVDFNDGTTAPGSENIQPNVQTPSGKQ